MSSQYRNCQGIRTVVNAALLVAAVLASIASVALVVAPPTIAEQLCGRQPCTWNFNQIKVPSAQPLGNHGAGVTVAIVDTWVDHTHPEIRDRVIGHANCVDRDGRCRSNTRNPDECTHGTHVAGTVASTNYGVAPKASLLAVQVLGYDGGTCSGSAEDVAAGVRFAASQGAHVINLSLGDLVPGVFQSPAVSSAVRDATRAGAVVIFAAGNSTVPVSDDYGSDAVLVSATGPDGRLASYSSRGGAIDLAAPGGDDGAAGLAACDRSTCILSTEPQGAYALREGTSMAAPHVSGAAALLLAQDPRRGRADVITTLRRTARPLSGVQDGLINAEAALRLHARPDATTPTTPGGTNSSVVRDTDPGARGSARPDATPRRSTPSGPGVPGAGPYAKDLTNSGWTAGAKEPETSGGETPGGQAPPLVQQQPRADTSDRVPLPVVVAAVALVALIGWVATCVSAGRARKRSTEWPEQ